VTALAWIYLVRLALAMDHLPADVGEAMGMTALRPWTALDFALMFLMWVVMMVGMMLPSAAPMILIYARVCRSSKSIQRPLIPVAVFVSGYLIAWTAFSLAATIAQWALEQAALLSPMMVSTSPLLGGALLIGAGIYQWTPYKDACLKHCRSPHDFISFHWRTGLPGALRMGLEHGAYCLGCCWLLMGLLFFGGVMSLLWIAAITLFVLLEKAAPFGARAGRMAGLGLVLFGAVVILGSFGSAP
jgi:predicted metal-binding membrane protein